MNWLASVLLATVGLGLEGLGLLFLIASAGRPHRLLVALAAIAAGAGCLVRGARRLRELARRHPDAVRAEILAEARRRSGAVSEVDLAALLADRWGIGKDVLAALVSGGVCRRQVAAESVLYLFPDLQPRLAIRRCKYCSAELPLGKEMISCPKCGGILETTVERAAPQSDDYRMDE